MDDPLRVGLIGVGGGASQLLPALTQGEHVRLTAAADVRADALEHFGSEFQVATYPSVEELCEHSDVEAVWIATPIHLHAEQTIAAAQRGKHVIVSKPMAISLAEAEAMNAAAERAGVHLLAGHTQSMAPTIGAMASMVASGELGRLGMVHTWHFTDWMYRPRLPAELDEQRGGGPEFRQASHQVDIVRYIAGGLVKSVRAATVQLDVQRGTAGAYTAYLEFQDGTPATIVYSGYGHFDSSAMLRGRERIGEAATPAPAARTAEQDAALKEAMRYTGQGARRATSNSLGLFGLTVVTCEQGDLRESPEGLLLYQHGAARSIPVEDEPRGAAELEEMYQAVRHGKPIVHDGRWGEATLEVCLAIHESARTHREVELTRQTAVPNLLAI